MDILTKEERGRPQRGSTEVVKEDIHEGGVREEEDLKTDTDTDLV